VLLIEDGSLRGSNLGMLTIQYLFLTGIDQNFNVFLKYFPSNMNFLNNQHLKFVNCPIFLQDVKTSMAVQNLVFDAYTNSVAS
jgi:hypothetical protein